LISLYSTQECHLCEMAFELTKQVGISQRVEKVDIALDNDLFLRYGVTIPVLKYQQSELNWPFDKQQLLNWLDNNGITYHT